MKTTHVAILVGLAMAASACGSSSTSPTTSTALGTPSLVSPAASASINATAQPITLTVANVSGASASATYTFEVASDSAFNTKVSTKTATSGSSGQTSVQADTLAAGATYYWHAKVTDGSSSGAFSNTNQFTIGATITIAAPVPVSPANGSASSGWPTMKVNNSVRTGPSGTLTYKFDVSTSSSFATIAFTATVAEGVGQTLFQPTPSQAATFGTTYYWRVTAIDATNGVSSAASTVQSFSYSSLAQGMASQQGFVLWPGVQPPVANFGSVKISAGWGLFTATSPIDGATVRSPTLEILRILDLLDRGMSGPAACDWLNANYGPTSALYYSGIEEGVIAFTYHYMAKNGANGEWELFFRIGA